MLKRIHQRLRNVLVLLCSLCLFAVGSRSPDVERRVASRGVGGTGVEPVTEPGRDRLGSEDTVRGMYVV